MMVREHRIASYKKGCSCGLCLAACRAQSQRLRDRRYASRTKRDDDVLCISCFSWFRPKGISRHEQVCQA